MKKYIKSGYDLDPTGKIAQAWEILVDMGVSEEALSLLTDVNGYSVDTLNDAARALFGEDVWDLLSR